MKVEDIQKAMEQVLTPLAQGIETLKSDLTKIGEKVDILEKGTEDAVQKAENATQTADKVTEQVEKTAEEIIKSALEPISKSLEGISKVVKSVSERVEKLENLRKSSSVGGEDPSEGRSVKKSTGIFDTAFSFDGR